MILNNECQLELHYNALCFLLFLQMRVQMNLHKLEYNHHRPATKIENRIYILQWMMMMMIMTMR